MNDEPKLRTLKTVLFEPWKVAILSGRRSIRTSIEVLDTMRDMFDAAFDSGRHSVGIVPLVQKRKKVRS